MPARGERGKGEIGELKLSPWLQLLTAAGKGEETPAGFWRYEGRPIARESHLQAERERERWEIRSKPRPGCVELAS